MAKEIGANWGTLIPRFLLATVFVFHGGQKLFGLFGAEPGQIEKLAAGIESWGWPMPGVMARAAAATEFFGGACLALGQDRKSTRLNSSHSQISYAVFCLKKTKYAYTNMNQLAPKD